ncbi:CoB--CoM heterodisulfide reductase iron-sulfur subunit B family protein [bacterium]|nr:CoB--CoM heterodisulfide reductase iron-sulfur subunit B family protein [bacterium]
MRYALFLGCSVPTRGLNYELSSRKVAEKLGIEFVDIPEFSCCGFPIRSVNQDAGFTMAARNLALAEKQGLDVITLCSACAETLQEANYIFKHNPDKLAQINKELAKFGLKYNASIEVKHFARLLWEDIGVETIKKSVVKPLVEATVVAHYGCHYLKPSEIYGKFDDPENPTSLDDLIEATGATTIRNYPEKEKCCGGAILGVKEEDTVKMAGSKLKSIVELGADAMILICPFCSVIYEGNQKKAEKEYDMQFKLPIIYYPQLLGLALGFEPDDVGFKLNRIKAKALLEKLGLRKKPAA